MAKVLIVDGIHSGKIGEHVSSFHDSSVNRKKYLVQFAPGEEFHEMELSYCVPATQKNIETHEKNVSLHLQLRVAKENGQTELAKEIIEEIKALKPKKKK